MSFYFKISFTGFLLVFLLYVVAFPQETTIRFRHLTTKDGLSSPFVNDIFRDSRGFMWFGTSNGLNRYDGYTTKVYIHDPSDTLSLSDNFIEALCEDPKGNLLIGTQKGGLDFFDIRTERFRHFRNDPSDPKSLSNDHVNVIYRDPKGDFWIGTQGGLNLYHPDKGEFTPFKAEPDNPKNPANQVLSILMDSQGQFWVGTIGGFFRFYPETGIFIPFPLKVNGQSGNSPENVTCLEEIHDGSIWIGTSNWLYILKNGNLEWLHSGLGWTKSPFNKFIHDVIGFEHDGTYHIWISTSWGFCRYNSDDQRFEHYFRNRDDPNSLSGYQTGTLFYDQKGILWISTPEQGVDMTSLRENPFHQVFGINNGHSTACFFEDMEGNFWVGSHAAGLLKYDRTFKNYRQFKPRFSDNSFFENVL